MEPLFRHYDNYLIFTIIVLIILPVFLALSSIFLSEILFFFQKYFNNGNLGVQLVFLLQYAIFGVMLIVYPIYPAVYPTKKYFEKRGALNAVKEYENLKKIVYVLFPLFVFGLIHLIGRAMGENLLLSVIRFHNNVLILISVFIGISFFIVASALLKITLIILRKEFRFYFAKVCLCVISNKEEDDVKKVRYVIKALNSYNIYLRKNIGLQIYALKNIYSKILSDSKVDKNQSIRELTSAFEDKDKLRPVKCLSTISNVTDTEQFLIKEPLGKKLENWATLIGTITSALAATISGLVTFISASS
jgi:hypothetical protein